MNEAANRRKITKEKHDHTETHTFGIFVSLEEARIRLAFASPDEARERARGLNNRSSDRFHSSNSHYAPGHGAKIVCVGEQKTPSLPI